MNFVTSKNIKKLIKDYTPLYAILLGMRSNGKSSAVKSYCLEEFKHNKSKFVYIRRYKDDMKNWMVERYFSNVEGFDVRKILDIDNGFIGAKNGELYICSNVIENGKDKRMWGESVGYSVALSEIEHYKSINFPDAKYIIFEEFVTTQPYLKDEVNMLFNFVSTIFRLNSGIVFLVANTISNINPYFREFELTNIDKQPINSIDMYINDNTRIAVWLTAPLDGNQNSKNMFFGERGKMINNGEWDRKQMKKLDYPYKQYNVLYEIVCCCNNKKYLLELLEKNNNHVWYITPKTTPIQKNTRLIGDCDIENDYTTTGFTPLNESEKRAFSLLKQGKIAFMDNLTGTEFIQAYKQIEKVVL